MGIVTLDTRLSSGINIIDFLNGSIENLDPAAVVKRISFDGLSKFNMQKVHSLAIFSDVDVLASISNGKIEFDMNTFWRSMRPLDMLAMRLTQETVYVPDEYQLIVIASDDPSFEYVPGQTRAHQFYSNKIAAVDNNAWKTLFFRFTPQSRTKIKVFNNDPGANDIQVDIQTLEFLDDPNDTWTSYEGYPVDVLAGNAHVFGDDATRDTQHHYHKVIVKAKNLGETSPNVKGVFFAI